MLLWVCLLLGSFNRQAFAAVCDVNGDGVIDKTDITLITAAANKKATGPTDPRDADHDGTITVLDARKCTLLCTYANCAPDTAPVANAGNDQSMTVGSTVTLDASGSYDVNPNDVLSYAWSFTSRAAGSAATLTNPTAVHPTFTIDKAGSYTVKLVVSDGRLSSSDTVQITTANSRPVANAGPDQTTYVTNTLVLNGALSTDADGDPLTYSWSILTRPPVSTATLINPTSVNPSFVVDRPGNYVVQLVVNDGSLNSLPDTVTVSTLNSKPVANAGPNQSALVTQTAHLDGSNSTDVDGDTLTYTWQFTDRPTGSAAALSDTHAVKPSFVIDKFGSYTVQLTVNDGHLDSNPSSVTVSTGNTPPVANAGSNKTVAVGDLVQLSGAGSTDVDGNPLTYLWSITNKPGGSTATLSNPALVNPTFVADKFGTYILQLIVNDGTADSAPATVTISTQNSAPIAVAGHPQTVPIGSLVNLDGSDSWDPDHNPLTFLWSLTKIPAGSTAALSDPTAVKPGFLADKAGSYTAQLIVNDATVDSAPSTVLITTENSQPVANAGTDKTVTAGTLVHLDGGASIDADGDPLTFKWSMTQIPVGSAAVLSDPTQVQPTFTADIAGMYIVQLIVNDGQVDSVPVTVTITATNLPNHAPVAVGDGYGVFEDAVLNVPAPGVLSNDTDADGNPLTAVQVSGPSHGALVLNADGSFTYTPAANYYGVDSFSYKASDGVAFSNTATVNILIAPVNDPPTLNAIGDLSIVQDSALQTVGLAGITSGAANEAQTLTVSASSGNPGLIPNPAVSYTSPNATATLSFTPVAGQIGSALITVVVKDNGGTANGGQDTIARTFTVTVSAAPPATVTLSPAPAQVPVRGGTLTMTATLDRAALSGGQLVNLSASNSIVTVPLSVTIPAGSLSTSFTVTSGNVTGSSVVTASAAGLAGSTATVDVQLRTFTLASPLLGLNRAVAATITLDLPAPAGGVTFNLSVADTGIAAVSPTSITIPEGNLSGTFQLTGLVTTGYTAVTADGTASGYVSKTSNISVTDQLLDLQPAADAYLGTTLTVPLLIEPNAAPAGGLVVAVTSSNPAIIQVLTPTVTVPQGALQTNIQLRAVTGAAGSATITASNAGYAPDVMQVTIKSGLNIMESFSAFPQSDTDPIHIQLLTAGEPYPAALPYPASAGGVAVTLASSETTCVAVPASITISAGATFNTATLSYGGTAALPCTATVTATNPLYGSTTVPVTVGQTPDLGALTIPDATGIGNRVGASLQFQYSVDLGANVSNPGVTVQIKSSNAAVARLSSSATSAGLPVVEVAVPSGQRYGYFYVQGVRGATGSSSLTVRNGRFTAGTAAVTVVQPVFQMNGLTTPTTTLAADDDFYVQAGVLNLAGTSIQQWQNVSGEGALPVTFTSSNPAVGQLATTNAGASSTGATLTINLPVNQYYTTASKAAGGMAFDALSGGSTTVAASAVGFNNAWPEASQAVTVIQPVMAIPDATGIGNRIGASLQFQYSVDLGANGTNHGGVTVHVASGDNSKVRLSNAATTAGGASVDIPIADGQRYGYFYVQGVRGATGSAILTATQALFTTATATIAVVPPVLQINSLTTPTTTLAADDDFYVQAGVLNLAGSSIQQWQDVSGEGPLPVTFTSSNQAVGQMAKTGSTGASLTVNIPVNQYYSPTSKASGGMAFDALSGGSTTVAASAVGFNNAWSEASQVVTVNQPVMAIPDATGIGNRIGASLQFRYSVDLGASATNHGGVTVHVASGDNSKVRLSTSATTAGGAGIDVPIADGDRYGYFYVQGVRGATGSATITATQALFTAGTATIAVVQPVLQINSLTTPTTTLAADDDFYVQAGVLNLAGSSIQQWQDVSGEGPLPVTFTSSNQAVGQMAKTGGTGASLTVNIPVNQYYTPSTKASGGMAFDALSGGSTTVAASAVGFNNSWSEASQVVTVNQPVMTIPDATGIGNRIGASLQFQYSVDLGASATNHGGVTVHVASSDNSKLRLSTAATTAGGAGIDVPIADGQRYGYFYVQGVRGATGSATITATQALFTAATATIAVVPPVLQINSLTTPTTTLAADDDFYVQAGVLNLAGTAVQQWQSVSGEGVLPVTFTSSNQAVGQMAKTGGTGASLTVNMPVNQYYTPTSKASGGMAFDALSAGSTTVAASAVGFNNAWSEASQVVTVNQPVLAIPDATGIGNRVGASLQFQYYVDLGANATNHGGVTVRVASNDTTKVLISASATTPGTSFTDIAIADGQRYGYFYVQGVRGTTGSATITAAQTLFTTGTATIAVVPPVLQINSLTTPTTTLAADDDFYVQAGVLNLAGTSIQQWQNVSGAGPLPVTITSSNPAVGQLATTGGTGATLTINMPVNQYYTPTSKASGGVAFDALSSGSTTVTATATGFNNAWSEESQVVTVTQ